VAFTAVMTNIAVIRSAGTPRRTRPDRLLADKGYSTRRIRESLRRRGINATPERRTRSPGVPPAINRLRGHRSVATRYDKREFVYHGTIDVACIGIWLRNPTGHDSRDTAW